MTQERKPNIFRWLTGRKDNRAILPAPDLFEVRHKSGSSIDVLLPEMGNFYDRYGDSNFTLTRYNVSPIAQALSLALQQDISPQEMVTSLSRSSGDEDGRSTLNLYQVESDGLIISCSFYPIDRNTQNVIDKPFSLVTTEEELLINTNHKSLTSPGEVSICTMRSNQKLPEYPKGVIRITVKAKDLSVGQTNNIQTMQDQIVNALRAVAKPPQNN